VVASSDDVDRHLAAIRVDCDQLAADLARLVDALAGRELTVSQASTLASALARVGQAGGRILARDLRRTQQRELGG
jgi:hypothetical protein